MECKWWLYCKKIGTCESGCVNPKERLDMYRFQKSLVPFLGGKET